MIDRYTPEWCDALFSDEYKYQLWARIEAEVVYHFTGTMHPVPNYEWLAEAVHDEERRTGHDVVALVNVLVREWKTQYVHYGLTSSDIVDTGWMMTLQRYLVELTANQIPWLLENVLALRSDEVVMAAGRTHGQIAVPIEWNTRVTRWANGLRVADLELVPSNFKTGKLSGPVGDYQGPISPEVELAILKNLGLRPAHRPGSQILPRSIFCNLVYHLVQVSQAIEQFALDIRLLSQTGIDEVHVEKTEHQVGSSAMPHKTNPILAERLCGQARLMRGYLQAMLESQSVWLERDISHSSVERVALVDACVTLASMVEGARTLAQRTRTHPAIMGTYQHGTALSSYADTLERIRNGETVWPK